MEASVSPKDEIWFLRVCHHISNAVYLYFQLSNQPAPRLRRYKLPVSTKPTGSLRSSHHPATWSLSKTTWIQFTPRFPVHLTSIFIESNVYRTVHHYNSWGIRNQLDVTCDIYYLIFAQHVSNINMSIFRSLRLYWRFTSIALFCDRCVLGFAANGVWKCPFCRFNLQNGHFQTSFAANPNTQRSQNKATDVVNRQYSRRLLKMDILMFETCWANIKCNKYHKWHQVGF